MDDIFSSTLWIMLMVIGLSLVLFFITTSSRHGSPATKSLWKNHWVNQTKRFAYASFGRRLGSQITDSILNAMIIPIFISMTLYYTQYRTLWDIVFWTKIYNNDPGNPNPTWWQLTGRYLSKFVTMFTFGIGVLMILWTEKRQALHDIMASTVVQKEWNIKWWSFILIVLIGLIVTWIKIGIDMESST